MIDFDFIEWDEPDDANGNVAHIARHSITVDEVEEVLQSDEGQDSISRATGRLVRFGWTSTGKHLIVVYIVEVDENFVLIRPITAYEVPPP